MTEAGIPVMGPPRLHPQSANAFGRKVVRGRGQEGDELLADALALQEAGCFAIVLEAVPAELGTRHHRGRRGGHHRHRRRARHRRPGAGDHRPARADTGPDPRFVKRYADLRSLITEAAGRFKDVAEGHYPGLSTSTTDRSRGGG